MNRNSGIIFLIFCFSLSSTNVVLATQDIEVSPIIVQPAYDLTDINQQMLERDRENRDQELAIKGLIDNNQKLTNTALAQREDDLLEKVNQTLVKYRDSVAARQRVRIDNNSQSDPDYPYTSLIHLTEDVDDVRDVGDTLQLKSGVIEEKYKMLTDLKDEMTALNEKLENQEANKSYERLTRDQEEKIERLTQRLGEMDQRIAHYDDILSKKDLQIAQLISNLEQVKIESAHKDENIQQQKNQLDLLKSELANKIGEGNNQDQQTVSQAQLEQVKAESASKDESIKQQKSQLDLLKSELESKISEENNPGQPGEAIQKEKQIAARAQSELVVKNQIIKEQEEQIAALKDQAQDLSSKEGILKSQADQMALASEQSKGQGTEYRNVRSELKVLREKLQQQDIDLKDKNRSIAYLNEFVAVFRNKTKYLNLTSDLSLRQFRKETQKIKDDFALRLKADTNFNYIISYLKTQVGALKRQLFQSQEQMESFKSEIRVKNLDGKVQEKQAAVLVQDLKTQLQDKDGQILKMRSDIQAILQDRANKEIYLHNASMQLDDRVKLAKQLIALQEEEAVLLNEKSDLEASGNAIFDQHVTDLENKIEQVLKDHQNQIAKLKSHSEELKNQLNVKEQEVGSLKIEIENKISEEKAQAVLQAQIQDLKSQVQGKTDQIATMTAEIETGHQAQAQVEALKLQLADQKSKVESLKEDLENKIAQSDKMSMMIAEYQQKVETKNNDYNDQLRKVLKSRDVQSKLEAQVAGLNIQLLEKEAQIANIKKDMSDIQEWTSAKDRDVQTKDLTMSMVQEKMTDEKLKEYQQKIDGLRANSDKQVLEVKNLKMELAMVRQALEGAPGSDELDFLKTGLQDAREQLKKKDELILQIKANAEEYVKEFKKESQGFQSLTQQLQSVRQEIDLKDENLKYKDMELKRFQILSKNREANLKAQIKSLTQRIDARQGKFMGIIHENKVEVLQDKLMQADLQIKELGNQLNQLELNSGQGTVQEKLKQALNKIDQQGRVINTLTQKLQDAGQSVDISRIINGG